MSKYSSNFPILHRGDIFLHHDKTFSARLIQFISHSYWNHAGIVVGYSFADDNYIILEASSKGITKAKLSKFPENELGIFRMPELHAPETARLMQYAHSMVGNPYDYPIVFRVIKRLGLFRSLYLLWKLIMHENTPKIPHIEDNWLVCSEYIQEVYSKAGIPLIGDDHLMLPGGISEVSSLKQIWGPKVN